MYGASEIFRARVRSDEIPQAAGAVGVNHRWLNPDDSLEPCAALSLFPLRRDSFDSLEGQGRAVLDIWWCQLDLFRPQVDYGRILWVYPRWGIL